MLSFRFLVFVVMFVLAIILCPVAESSPTLKPWSKFCYYVSIFSLRIFCWFFHCLYYITPSHESQEIFYTTHKKTLPNGQGKKIIFSFWSSFASLSWGVRLHRHFNFPRNLRPPFNTSRLSYCSIPLSHALGELYMGLIRISTYAVCRLAIPYFVSYSASDLRQLPFV